MNQAAEILDYLRAGRSLTAIEALSRFGCFRLAARIKDLRDAGHPIVTDTVTQDGKQYARYSLSKGQMSLL